MYFILVIGILLIILKYNQQKKIVNPLIVILSCQENSHLWENILKKHNNTIIFCGDPKLKKKFVLKDRILYLQCEDTYDHLPTKVIMMIYAILHIHKFSHITHIFKLDDHDTQFNNKITKTIKNTININGNYYGQRIIRGSGSRRWHYGKCPKTSLWYNKPYMGKFVPWCDGGNGYILSRKSMQIILNCIPDIKSVYKEHIYEDLMISILLHKNKIYPKKIKKIIVGDK